MLCCQMMPRAQSCVKRLLEDSGARGFLVKICKNFERLCSGQLCVHPAALCADSHHSRNSRYAGT